MPKRNLNEIRRVLRKRIRDLRNVETFADRDEFAEAYERASEQEASEAGSMIERGDSDGLRAWAKDILGRNRGIEDCTVRELRAICAERGIPGSSRWNKAEILAEIHRHQNRKK